MNIKLWTYLTQAKVINCYTLHTIINTDDIEIFILQQESTPQLINFIKSTTTSKIFIT